jgi:hypothetical protein
MNLKGHYLELVVQYWRARLLEMECEGLISKKIYPDVNLN